MRRFDCLTRRRFLQVGTSAALGLTLPRLFAQDTAGGSGVNCIMLVLVGGPSQLDTWDPKPNAPVDFRGPFRPIATSVPGMHVSELFPRMAQLAGKYSLVRSMHHPESVTHETGRQLIQTFIQGAERPRSACLSGQRPGKLDERYGRTRFGQSCWQARRLIEQGVRFVTVNMFETVFDTPTWDIHGMRPFSDFQHLAQDVAPSFDQAFSTLVEDLDQRGLLQTTMVVAVGEFGRSPRINPHGGRDHHAHAWTMVIGGGPIRGGRIIGATDEIGFAPTSRPVTTSELAATIYHGLGVDLDRQRKPNGLDGLVEAGVRPILELF